MGYCNGEETNTKTKGNNKNRAQQQKTQNTRCMRNL